MDQQTKARCAQASIARDSSLAMCRVSCSYYLGKHVIFSSTQIFAPTSLQTIMSFRELVIAEDKLMKTLGYLPPPFLLSIFNFLYSDCKKKKKNLLCGITSKFFCFPSHKHYTSSVFPRVTTFQKYPAGLWPVLSHVPSQPSEYYQCVERSNLAVSGGMCPMASCSVPHLVQSI